MLSSKLSFDKSLCHHLPSFFRKKRYKTLCIFCLCFNIFQRVRSRFNVNIFRSPPPAFYEVLGIFKKPVRKKPPPLFFILGGGGFFLEIPSDTEKPVSPGLLSIAEIFLQGRGWVRGLLVCLSCCPVCVLCPLISIKGIAILFLAACQIRAFLLLWCGAAVLLVRDLILICWSCRECLPLLSALVICSTLYHFKKSMLFCYRIQNNNIIPGAVV